MILALECVDRAIAIAWRWPPDIRATSLSIDGTRTPMSSRYSRERFRIARLLRKRSGPRPTVSSRLRNMLW